VRHTLLQRTHFMPDLIDLLHHPDANVCMLGREGHDYPLNIPGIHGSSLVLLVVLCFTTDRCTQHGHFIVPAHNVRVWWRRHAPYTIDSLFVGLGGVQQRWCC
jgi:hypothetical protein